MAQKATVFKADIHIADMDRSYYAAHNLTIARHPSETDERMMIRILAFALNAHEDLHFTKGLSAENEPEIWKKNLVGETLLWIELGLPDEKRIRKACQRARQVILYTYGGGAANIWWSAILHKLDRFDNLSIYNLHKEITDILAGMAKRTMELHFCIEDQQVTVNDSEQSLVIEPDIWRASRNR